MDPAAAPAGLDLWPYLDPFLSYVFIPALIPLIAWFVNKTAKWLGVEMDDRQRAAVLATVERGAGAMLRKHAQDLRGRLTIPLSHPAVAEAAEYVQRRVPDTLKKMKLSGEDIRDLISTHIASRLDIELPPSKPMTEQEILHELKDLLQQFVELQTPKGV